MSNSKIRFLQPIIIGRGEVKGFVFTLIRKTDRAFLYEVNTGDSIHYECFKRVLNVLYKCESYPTSKAFGLWAWTFLELEQAEQKFIELSNYE